MLKSTAQMKKWCFAGSVVLVFLTIGIYPAIAADNVFKSKSKIAIRGLDAVAFHTEKRAVKGQKEFFYRWHDARWYFKSAENRDLFESDPLRFAPQFGGN